MFRTQLHFSDALAAGAVLLSAVLLLCVPLFFDRGGETLTVTTPDGVSEYSLATDQELEITARGITLFVKIQNHRVTVVESTCPDKICKSSRAISHSGESIVCAPAGIVLRVTGGDGDVDFVAG